MNMDDNSGDAYLTAKEISKCLRIPLNTIYRLTKQGNIKGVKVGKQWRYCKYDFEKWLAGEIDTRAIHLERYKERRNYPRMNCDFKCESRMNISGQKDFGLTDGNITNISGGGVFLRYQHKDLDRINIGDPVDINFDLLSDIDGILHNIDAKGRVVRKTCNGVGIKFRHIDDRYKDLITKFVD